MVDIEYKYVQFNEDQQAYLVRIPLPATFDPYLSVYPLADYGSREDALKAAVKARDFDYERYYGIEDLGRIRGPERLREQAALCPVSLPDGSIPMPPWMKQAYLAHVEAVKAAGRDSAEGSALPEIATPGKKEKGARRKPIIGLSGKVGVAAHYNKDGFVIAFKPTWYEVIDGKRTQKRSYVGGIKDPESRDKAWVEACRTVDQKNGDKVLLSVDYLKLRNKELKYLFDE